MRSVSLSSAETLFGRNARDLGDHLLDVAQRDGLPPLMLRQQHPGRADFVDHVDRLVGQLAVVDVFGGQLHRGADRLVGVAHLVVLLVVRLQAAQDLHAVFDVRLVDVDLLEAADQRAVLLEVVAELLVGGGADAAQVARRQRRLQQVRRIHRAAAGRAGADHGVDLVDEQDGALLVLQLAHHRLQPLLEVAAVAGAGQQRAHVQREDGGARQHLRHVAFDDALGQALGDRRLADARVAHIERVVLGAAAQDLDGPLDLRLAADQRIDLPGHRLLVQVHAVVRQRVLVPPVRLLLPLLLRVSLRLAAGAGDRALGRSAGRLGDAVADEVHRIEPGHVLQLQEIHRVAFALGEQRHQHVGPGHLVAAGGLHVDRRALHDALEPGGRLRVTRPIRRQARQVLVEKFAQIGSQLVQVHPAGTQHRRRVGVVRQPEQQMLQRGVFVAAFAREGQRAVQRLFEIP